MIKTYKEGKLETVENKNINKKEEANKKVRANLKDLFNNLYNKFTGYNNP